MHLLKRFGSSIDEIKKDGFKVDDKIYMALDGYNNYTMSKSLGVLITSFTDVIHRVKPDWLVLAGDRGETLAASIVGAYKIYLWRIFRQVRYLEILMVWLDTLLENLPIFI